MNLGIPCVGIDYAIEFEFWTVHNYREHWKDNMSGRLITYSREELLSVMNHKLRVSISLVYVFDISIAKGGDAT